MPGHTEEEREAALGGTFLGVAPLGVAMDQETGFFDFLLAAGNTAVDAFVVRQQFRQMQPAIAAPVAAAVPVRQPISGTNLLIGAGVVGVLILALVR